MPDPREEINLSDYEKHMSPDSVRQLQVMNQMVKGNRQTHHRSPQKALPDLIRQGFFVGAFSGRRSDAHVDSV